MADQEFKIGFAIGVQSGFGTPNATIAGLSGSLSSSDGIVLGDRESGDAESGILIPSIESAFREVAAVSGSFTEQADAFLRAVVNGFGIALPLQGNGATATPATGEAQPLAGIDATLQSLGLAGANGTAPVVAYTPVSGATVYSTIKLWIGDLSFVFTDCIVESGQVVFTPGGNGILTANFAVGTHDPATDFADGVTFPTFDYTTQASLAAPTVEGVNFTWGQVRGFNTLTLNIENTIEEAGDSNVASTGLRQTQTRRMFTIDGTLYLDDGDSDFEYQGLVSSSAPTADLSFQVGDVAGAAEVLNAYLVEVNNLQAKAIKYNRIGTATVVELTGAKATATAAGGEFTLTFN